MCHLPEKFRPRSASRPIRAAPRRSRGLPCALWCVAAALWMVRGAGAAEPLRVFPGASPEDMSRGLPEGAFAPQYRTDRAFMESYSAWIQLEDGSTLLINLPLTNLPSPHECSVAVDLYRPDGREVLGEAQFSSDRLEVSNSRVSCGGNVLEQVGPGAYRLRADLPRSDQAGRLSVDLSFVATIPGFRRGDGRVHFGEEGYFELRLLVPWGTVTGRYTLDGVQHTATGQVYLDYAAQSLWAHELADFWLSYRFFSDTLYMAATTFRTPNDRGRKTIHHVTVVLENECEGGSSGVATGDANGTGSDSGRVPCSRRAFVTGKQALELTGAVFDTWSGYEVPGHVRAVVQGPGVQVELALDTSPNLLSKEYILAPLNPLVRAVISTFIARPYTYRYRARVIARVTSADGTSRPVPGTFVGEMIFVNSP